MKRRNLHWEERALLGGTPEEVLADLDGAGRDSASGDKADSRDGVDLVDHKADSRNRTERLRFLGF